MKFRRATKHFLEGKTVACYYIIECLHMGKWLPMGNNDGLLKYKTPKERDDKLAELEENCKAI